MGPAAAEDPLVKALLHGLTDEEDADETPRARPAIHDGDRLLAHDHAAHEPEPEDVGDDFARFLKEKK